MGEHSFQMPIPNSPLLLSYLCSGAQFLQESSLTAEVLFYSRILARVCAVAIAMGLVKNKANLVPRDFSLAFPQAREKVLGTRLKQGQEPLFSQEA